MPRAKCKYGKYTVFKRFTVSSAVIWNSLSAALQATLLTAAMFTEHLKAYSSFASTNNTSEDCTLHYTNVLIIVVIIISTSDTTSKWRSLAITFTGALPRALCQSFNLNDKC